MSEFGRRWVPLHDSRNSRNPSPSVLPLVINLLKDSAVVFVPDVFTGQQVGRVPFNLLQPGPRFGKEKLGHFDPEPTAVSVMHDEVGPLTGGDTKVFPVAIDEVEYLPLDSFFRTRCHD